MHETHSLRERFLVFFKIFVPILIYQFANFSAAFVDTTMTGQYDALHLAGVAMATSLWSPFFTFLTGIVSALVPIIGHHLGAGRKDRVAPDFYQFLYMALGLSLILFALVFLGAPLVLNHLGLEPLVRKVALGYLRFLSLGIIPLLLFSVVRSFLDALGLHAPFHVPHASAPTSQWFLQFPPHLWHCWFTRVRRSWSWTWNFIGLLGPSSYFHLGYQKA